MITRDLGEWEARLAEWRRNPTVVIQCPDCNALHGQHVANCDIDPRNHQSLSKSELDGERYDKR